MATCFSTFWVLLLLSPSFMELVIIQPGVVFCLRQKSGAPEMESYNPLQPYFLVYVRDDHTVRYTFAQPKQILQVYRLLCAEQPRAYEALCHLFDQETAQGKEMARYNGLLDSAVQSIERTFKKRAVAQLQLGRGGLLPTLQQQVHAQTDFELITWLIIK